MIIAKLYKPAKISSAITKNAPFLLSSHFIPNGFIMSKSRNKTKDNAINHKSVTGVATNGIHTPMISSITILLGSSPQKGIRHLVAHVPKIVNNIILVIVKYGSMHDDTQHDKVYQLSTPNNAPALPGPHGQKPIPNPVPINVGKIGSLSIQRRKISRKILKSKKFSCFF